MSQNSSKLGFALGAALLSAGVAHSAHSLELAQSPLFLAQPVRPLVMLNLSNDHQLFFKAYDDYSDLTGDGAPDPTYTHSHSYYGYFDSGKCYVYRNDRFEPERAAGADGYCGGEGEWSGNFLNWAGMTRMDAVRKILYGGYRSTDTGSETVLERAFLPHDAHAYAKYYDGEDIRKLTPFKRKEKEETGITICNTTAGDGLSQSVNSPPLLRVARGNFSLWASNERWQCTWLDGNNPRVSSGNANKPEQSGIDAHSFYPNIWDHQLREGDYIARVKVCVPGLEEDNCRPYPKGNTKPAGLLQKYGEKGEILFGLVTGSYGKNKSGGVLRKNIGDLTDEINAKADGTFDTSATDSIIKTLNLLRIYGYSYAGGDYGSNNCYLGRTSFADGECSNWGNPQSEIYLESLRYLAGLNATPAYSADDSAYIPGLAGATWKDPLNEKNYCAPLNIIQFNASTSSYDGEVSGPAAGLGIDSVAAWTDKVGKGEGIHGGSYFVGTNGTDNNQLCTAKTVSALSAVTGTCPDAPRLDGTYHIGGLAHFARSAGIRSDFASQRKVRTYGVALAAAIPKVEIPIPGSKQKVTLLPACRNTTTTPSSNCAIVDFKIVAQDSGAGVNSGKLYVNWEDSEQGNDYDQDMWGIIDYTVTGNSVSVTTNVIAQSTPHQMGFGYVIGGTTADGFQVHSGINGFTAGDCDNCQSGDDATSRTFAVGTSSASALEPPLYYAAKWGGYDDDGATAAEIAAASPNTYFYAVDPAQLEEDLGKALAQVAASVGSASAVATNSTRLDTDTVVYQALFNSGDWSGEIRAVALNNDGSLGATQWSSRNSGTFTSPANRSIVTYDGSKGVEFLWNKLSDSQRTQLAGDAGEAVGKTRLNWLRGQSAAGLRERETPLGDIVNSSPVFAGPSSLGFERLPEGLGGSSYTAYVTAKAKRREMLYVSANDGMMHAFDAKTGKETFAYVPSSIFGKLRDLTAPNYGAPANPHRYNMDGPLFVGDAYFGGKWHTVVTGTLGAGGRGIFALDVTTPTAFGPGKVLFELTEDDIPGLGNVVGRPLIAPTTDGWKVIFGNGYNSDGGKARLLAVDLQKPKEKSRVIAADNGDNGLAAPSLLTDDTGVVTAAYAGDLQGNLWKFDLSDDDPDKWSLAFPDKKPLFKARDSSDRVQPITAAPTLGRNAQLDNAVMVYFGTGRYLSNSDNAAGETVQSFYAIADQGEPLGTADSRKDLKQKKITSESGQRVVESDGDLDWSSDIDGWYLDLIYADKKTGERVISRPLLKYDRLLFPTLITSSDPCAFGGSGWLMELVAVGDYYQGHSIFGDSEQSGLMLDSAVMGLSAAITDGKHIYLPTGNIKGEITVTKGNLPAGVAGRMSWRQLR
ncbi:pilus assembly protein [Microbulbifer rhizosphaerae]|uniref:Type IV pilus assembly protein PilY1 n=1 Tax=Microbulbifer rhizosphaerae TaxID=1562603 RepID=A0A7W4WEZ4_9GAMM|nr:PilC/PilY family type IV pilus protein [Microbulbifer rhizosphaerae]MBB3062423.1 type IV pilus assembly protein PilY1 [Microbulbifer rhizosphaerae]